jgi:hypothetical protein
VSSPRIEGPASLPLLGKRMHVRVLVPPAVRVYAQVRTALGALSSARGVVADLSAGGMLVQFIEGGRFDLPSEGGEAQVVLDYEGDEATVNARVVRASAREASFAFPEARHDAELNLELLTILASLVTRRIELVSRRAGVEGLASRLTHRHFYGAGHLDLRVETKEPAWWQAVFLEYLMSWSRKDGQLHTGTVDRSFSPERAADPMALRPNVTRHAEPWPKLRKLAGIVASKCSHSMAGHMDAFRLIKKSL